MKYRLRLLIVDAFRMGIDNIPDWAMDRISSNDIRLKSPTDNELDPFQHNNDTYCLFKNTLGYTEVANHGDYVILNDNDKLSSLTKDLFDMIYIPIK